jgi:MarR family transcriptional regulator for hemolysin
MASIPGKRTSLTVDCVGRKLTLAARTARHVLEAHLAGAGITYAGYVALNSLRRRQPLMQRQLAQLLDVEGPTLTRQLERLERQGLVTRRRVASDRRVTLVELTAAGLKTVEELQEVVAEAADEVAADLTGEQVEQLSALLDRIIGRSQSRLRPVASVPEPDDP